MLAVLFFNFSVRLSVQSGEMWVTVIASDPSFNALVPLAINSL